jgi:hypothetical protein
MKSCANYELADKRRQCLKARDFEKILEAKTFKNE